jgi:hypothetical protein
VPKGGGDGSNVTDHRPIALIPVPAKIFESVLYGQIMSQIGNKIINSQHGFRPRRGVQTNLACFVQDLSEWIDQGLQVDAVYTDFRKAFDTVDHSILIQKMGELGFSSCALQLLESYLTDREQYVGYRNAVSYSFPCPSGVPQGSNLGPLFFIIFINDIGDDVKHSKVLLYADDMKIYRPVKCKGDCKLLQNDVDSVVRWSEKNRLPFNVRKCVKIVYTRNITRVIHSIYYIKNEKLANVECVRDLGVTLDRGITFKDHTTEVIRKAKRTLGFIIRNSKNFKNIQTLTVLYFAIVRSNLEFASLIWNPYSATLSEDLEKIQKRFLKYLYFKTFEYYPSELAYSELLQGFGIHTLEKRRSVASLLFLYDILRGRIQEPALLSKININVPRVNSKCTLTFRPPTSRTNLLKYSILHRACHLYNKICNSNPDLHIDIFHEPRLAFQKILMSINMI